MLRRFSINFALFSMLLDGLAVDLSLLLSSRFRPLLNAFSFIEPITTPPEIPRPLYAIFPLIWFLIFSSFSLYDGRKFFRVVDEFSTLVLATLISSISTAGILYLSFREISRAQFLVFVSLVYGLCFAWRVMARAYFRSQTVAPVRARRVLVVGSGSLGEKVRVQLKEPGVNAVDFIGFVDDGVAGNKAVTLLGGTGQIVDIALEHEISDVVIALPHSAYHQMGEIIGRLEPLPIRVWVALGFFDLTLYNTAIEDFAGIPMLDLRASAIDDYQRMVKRSMDFVGSLTALVLSTPLFILCTIMVVLEDGFPVLFHQQRVGENGRLFEMLKFRTMVRNAEGLKDEVERLDVNGNLIHKVREDPRVTRVGRFLRRFSLDELPQFINVVRGDMSLVGPRPELPYLVDRYQPWQRKRFSVPPGMTGWWQVNGRGDRPMHLNTEDDLYYIQNYSIFLDIQILLKTVWVVLIGKGSY
jgi:exopolysaccharide biosynthesis polyprenyl glycosylphosphotransferase